MAPLAFRHKKHEAPRRTLTGEDAQVANRPVIKPPLLRQKRTIKSQLKPRLGNIMACLAVPLVVVQSDSNFTYQ